MKNIILILVLPVLTLILITGLLTGCGQGNSVPPLLKTVPQETAWGIYKLDIASQEVTLVYSFPVDTYPSGLRLNNAGDRFVFVQKVDGSDDNTTEIFSLGIDNSDLKKLTINGYFDVYPVWSPDDKHIAFLSWRDKDLDIYIMDADGHNEVKLFDSGNHDADIDWVGNSIVFTAQSAIWVMNNDGIQAEQVTDFPGMGQWGKANLPAGDYDPRLSPDGQKIVFERLENTDIPNGGYNFFLIGKDGSSETRLTSNGYSQGLANWSQSGKELVYVVAAIDGQGEYDIYMMNADGTGNRNLTPGYFPGDFLCHSPVFSPDDKSIYFLGQWWENS
jgi:TolB protein